MFPRVFNQAVEEVLNAGGKLIRPVLALCAAEINGRPYNARALDSAVALELVHVSSLILDDIIDESPKRRGIKSLHVKYGNDVAIVSAGMLLLRGLRDVAEVKRTRKIGYDAFLKLVLGQAIEARGNIRSEREYLRMIELKTATLFEAAMLIGSAAGNLGRVKTSKLINYGRAIGIAFQLKDDLLDFIGSENKLGKPIGSDFRNGKPSIVTVRLYKAPGTNRVRLSQRATLQARKSASTEEIIRQVEQLANEYSEHALAAIEDLRDTPAKRCLIELGRSICRRDS